MNGQAVNGGEVVRGLPHVYSFVPTAAPASVVLYGPGGDISKSSASWGYVAASDGAGGYTYSFTPDEVGVWTVLHKDGSSNVVDRASFRCVLATQAQHTIGVQPNGNGVADIYPTHFFSGSGGGTAAGVSNAGNTWQVLANAYKWVVPQTGYIHGIKFAATAAIASMTSFKFFTISPAGILRGRSENMAGYTPISGAWASGTQTYWFRQPVPARVGDWWGFEVQAPAGQTNANWTQRKTVISTVAATSQILNRPGSALSTSATNTFSTWSTGITDILDCHLLMHPPAIVVGGHSFYTGSQDTGTSTASIYDYCSSSSNIPFSASVDCAALLEQYLGVPVVNCAVGGTALANWVGAVRYTGDNSANIGGGWFESSVKPLNPSVLLFDTGYNDAIASGTNANISNATYLGYLDRLLWHCQQAAVELVLCESPSSYSAVNETTPRISNLERMRAITTRWAEQNGCMFIPTYYALGQNAGAESADRRYTLKRSDAGAFLPDYDGGSRIHFNQYSRKAWAVTVAQAFRNRRYMITPLNRYVSAESSLEPASSLNSTVLTKLDAAVSSRTSPADLTSIKNTILSR